MFSNRDLGKLLIPLMIEQLLTSLIGTVDTMMVANLGAAPVSGVSLVDSITKLVIFLFTALATGGSIVCSQYWGRGDRPNSRKAAQQVMLSVTVLALMVMGVFLLLRRQILRLIFGSVEKAVMEAALEYFSITILAYPFIAIFGAGAALFRAQGNSALPMRISLVTNLINISGNAFFMFVLDMGVAGAALASLLSYAVGAAAILVFLRKPGQTVELGRFRDIRPDFSMIWLVLCIGIPTGIENAMFQFGKLAVQSTVSTLSTAAIAANAIVVVLELLTSMPSMGISTGLMTVVGKCMGAGRPDEAKHYIKKLTIWSFITLTVMNWGIFALTPAVTRLAGLEPESAELAVKVMLVISVAKPLLWPFAFVPANGMRAAGDVKFGMVVSTATMWIFRVGLAVLLCRRADWGLYGIWAGYFADWLARSVIFCTRYLRGKWALHRVIDRK